MKTPFLPVACRFLPTAAALAMLGLPLHAAIVTWDFGAATNAWSTGTNWDTNAEPTSADDVVLAAGLGTTLTLSAGENAKSLQFNDDYTLTGGGLTLAAASTIGVALGEIGSIGTALTTTGGLTKLGDGTLTLGATTGGISGGVLVSAGRLRLTSANAVNSGNTITVNAGTTLEVANITTDRSIAWKNGATLAGSGTASFTGVITIDALATAVTVATAVPSDVLTLGTGANDLTGGSAATTITVSGPGATRLGAASNYAGSWLVESGARLDLAATAALGGNAAGGVTLAGGTLAGRMASDVTFTGPVNLTLTASSSLVSDRSSAATAETYTFGTLAMGTHTLTVAPGALPNGGTAGITVGNVTLSGDATFAVNDGGNANGKLNTGSLLGGGVARTITKTGAGDLALTGGATDLVAGSSFTMSGGGNLDLLFPALGAGATVAVSDAQHPLGASTFSQTGGALNLLADGDNTNAIQNFVLANGFTLSGDITLDPNRRSGTGNTRKTFDIPTLTLGAGTVLTMVGDNTYGVRITGATTLQGNVTLQGTATTSRDGLLTLDGAIGDGGSGYSLTIAGGGLASPLNLTLNGASTYSGGTTMSGSTVTLNSANALGTGPLAQAGGTIIVNVDGAIGDAITLSGGTLQVNDLDALTGNTVALNGGILDLRTNVVGTFTTGALTLGGDATMSFARISGGGAFTPTFGSTINVSGNRTLTITNANSLTPNLANIALAGDLTLSSAIAVSVQSISQDATPRRFIKAGTGTTTLTGTGSFSGGAEVIGGILSINDTTALGGNVLTVGDASGVATAQVLLAVGPSLANDIVIRTGSSGTPTLRTTVSGLTWAGNVALQRTGTLETTTLATFSGILSGVGNVSKTGGGEIILENAANSFGNGTAASINITAGSLTVSNDGALGNAANGVTIAAGTTFRANGTFTTAHVLTPGASLANIDVTAGNTLTLTNSIGGFNPFDKEGLGTLAFGPAVTSTRTSSVTINDGTIQLSTATSLGIGGPVLLVGGTLDLRNDASTNYAHPLSIQIGTNIINVDRAVGGSASGGTHTLGTVGLQNFTLNTTGSNDFGLDLGAVGTTGTSTINHDAPGALTVAAIALGGTSGTFTFTMDGDGGDVSITGTIADSGTPIWNFAKRGSHTLHLGTGFTIDGTVTVADGTLDLNSANVTLPSTLTIGGGALSTAASITTGEGTLMLGGNLTYSTNSSAFPADITGNLDLGAVARTFTINDNFNTAVDLDLVGTLSGAAGIGFTKAGNGTLRLSGAAGNTFTGLTTVPVGTLELGKSSGDAISLGGLSINTTSAATVRLTASNQINDAAAVSVTNTAGTARLDLAGFSETLGATTLTATTTSGASITTGAAGTLVLGADLTLANNFSSTSATTTLRRMLVTGTGTTTIATTDGTLDLGGAVRNIAVTTTVIGANAANANAMIETAIVNGGINKVGPQTLYLTNPASTFAGGLNIAEGIVDVSANGAAGVGPITFNNTATSSLRLSTDEMTLSNPIIISASGAAEAKLVFSGGIYTEATLSGPITLERDLTVEVTTGLIDQSDGDLFGRLIVSGNIDDGAGTFSVTKKGKGVLRLTGANTHGGGTFVEKGTLAFSADTALGQTGVPLTINGGALFAEATLTTARDVVFTSAGSFRVESPNVLELAGALTHGANDIGFFGSGTTILSGTGGGGAGNWILGKYASDHADVFGTPEINLGHVLSVRGSVALPTGNIWIQNDAVLELGTGDFTRAVGTGAGQVRMETYIGAGFAAHGANRVVNLGGTGATLIWGDPVTKFLRALVPNQAFESSGALILGSATATHTVDFQNPIEFNNGDATSSRSITVPDGPAAKEAVISGDLSLNGLPGTTNIFLELNVAGALDITGDLSGEITLDFYGGGTLTLAGTNTHTGGIFIEGFAGPSTLIVNSGAALGDAGSFVELFDDATLRAGGTVTSDHFFGLYGVNTVIDTNGFAVTLGAGSEIEGDELIKNGAGTLTVAGIQNYNTLTANAGTTNVDSPLGSGFSVVNANAAVNFGVSQTLDALNIGAGAEVTFGDGLPFAGGPGKSGALVPEPGSLGLLAVGALGVLSRRRRKAD